MKPGEFLEAYHQVGLDGWTAEERASALDEILDLGYIPPATERVQGREMFRECFTEESYAAPIEHRFKGATAKAMQALDEMARERIEAMPHEGTTHTMFNCVDLLSGELDKVFLSTGSWYSGEPNGFVFDAEDLILRGAHFRSQDLMEGFEEAIKEAVRHRYKSVREARGVIEAMLGGVLDEASLTGSAGVKELLACAREGEGGVCRDAEVVWQGRLPVKLAAEVWRNGTLIR